jgi:hypothetical protein
MPIFIGGLVRGLVDRVRKMSDEESDSSPAVLLSSGLIAGGSIAGILLAFLAVFPEIGRALDLSKYLPEKWEEAPRPAILAFSVLIGVLLWVGLKGKNPTLKEKDPDAADLGP